MKNKISTETSLVRLPEILRSVLVLGAIFLLVIGFTFLLEQNLHPPCCDAKNYLELAKKYNVEGIAVKEPLRTFAYPLILSLVIKTSQTTNLPESLLVFLLQISVYYLAIVVVSNVASEYSRKLSTAMYIALCLNFFVIPYASITLTDSLYTSLSMLIFGGIMKIESLQRSEQSISAKWVFLGILLLSLAIVIRPAAVWLAAPTLYCLVRSVWKRGVRIFDFLLAAIAGAAPLYIQIALNFTNYKVISFLPVTDLGGAQIKWGIENIKYGTWMGSVENFYPSGHLIDIHSRELNLWWYFNNPVDSIKLLTFKLIGAFDFDYIIPYPYHQLHHEWIATFFSFTILWIGVFGISVHLCTKKLPVLGSRFMPVIIFTGWCAISLISALELRFTLPLISYFIIVSCAVGDFIVVNKNKKILLFLIAGWLICLPFFYQAAKFIRLQSVL
jgi:hypothetical protein